MALVVPSAMVVSLAPALLLAMVATPSPMAMAASLLGLRCNVVDLRPHTTRTPSEPIPHSLRHTLTHAFPTFTGTNLPRFHNMFRLTHRVYQGYGVFRLSPEWSSAFRQAQHKSTHASTTCFMKNTKDLEKLSAASIALSAGSSMYTKINTTHTRLFQFGLSWHLADQEAFPFG